MKPVNSIGMIAAMIGLCAVFGYAGSVLSQWDQPVHASSPNAVKRSEPQGPSAIQAAAVASAQELTDLTQ